MDMVNVKVNGTPLSVPKNYTVLEAAREAGFDIPTLCFLKDINEIGACRMCVAEVKGARSLVASCVYPVNEGMEILTNTPKIQKARKMTLEMLLSVHDRKCLTCKRNGNCELQTLCNELGVDDTETYEGDVPEAQRDESTLHLIRDNSKCILCRRCVAACQQQYVSVIGTNGRGFDTHVACSFEKPLSEVACVSCGQCIVSCPTGALTERDQCQEVLDAIGEYEAYLLNPEEYGGTYYFGFRSGDDYFLQSVPKPPIPPEPPEKTRALLIWPGSMELKWDFYKKHCRNYGEVLLDIASVCQTLHNFIRMELSGLYHLTPDNYVAALHGFLFNDRAHKWIANPVEKTGFYTRMDDVRLHLIPRETAPGSGTFKVNEYYEAGRLQTMLKLDFYKALEVGHLIRK